MYNKEYHEKYREKHREHIQEYSRLYAKGIKLGRQYVKYVIYDLKDNYIFEGTIKEIAKYLDRTEKSINSTISHIKHNRGNRKYIRVNGIRCTIHKMEE